MRARSNSLTFPARLFVAALAVFLLLPASAQYRIETLVGGGGGDGGAAIAASIGTLQAIAVDAAGTMYFSDGLRVRKFTPGGTIHAVAGNGASGFSGDGGPATAATFFGINGLAVDAAGNVYVVDRSSVRIRKIDTGGIITTFAGTGSFGSTGDGGAATSATLSNIEGIAIAADGSVLIADGNRVRRVTTAGIISTVVGTASAGFVGDGAQAAAALFNDIKGIAIDGTGNLYLVDYNNRRIRKVDATGIVTTVAGNGDPGSGTDGPALTQAISPRYITVNGVGEVFFATEGNTVLRLSSGTLTRLACPCGSFGENVPATSSDVVPRGVAAFGSNLYVADVRYQRVRAIDGTGIINTVAGSGINNFAGDGGPAIQAALSSPQAIHRAQDGSLLIWTSDARIRKVATDGTISTIAGTGSSGTGGDGGPASLAQVGGFGKIASDAAGSVYLADQQFHTIRKIDTSGNISTIGGNNVFGGGGDGGAATLANIGSPTDLALDAAGNIFVAQPSFHRIRRIGTDGNISTVAGTGVAGQSGLGGPATLAQISGPQAIHVEPSGRVHIGHGCRVDILELDGTLQGGLNNGCVQSSTLHFAGENSYVIGQSNRIYLLTSQGTTQVAGSGNSNYTGDGGPALNAGMSLADIHVESDGTILVADGNNHRVRRLLAPPSKVRNVQVSPAPGQVTVAFDTPSAPGSSPITGYTLNCGTGATGASTTSPIILTGLTNGQSYFCQLTASNAIGNSSPVQFNTIPGDDPGFQVTSLPSGTFGTAYQADITVAASPNAGIFVLSGSLPPGMSQNNVAANTLRLQGTPFAVGTFNFVVRAQNALGFADQAFQIIVGKASQTLVFSPAPTIEFGSSILVSYSSNAGLDATITSETPAVCQLPNQIYSSGNNYFVSPLTAGTCTITVAQGGNANYLPATSVTRSIVVIPGTQITSAPGQQTGVSNSSTATITFASQGSPATFECKLDGDSFTPCVSGHQYTGLGEGLHTVQVRAKDGAGNVDPTPDQASWRVDLTPPLTTIDSGPIGSSPLRRAVFNFSANEDTLGYECRLDGSPWTACLANGQHIYENLAQGIYTFDVRAIDLGGNIDPSPASRTWAVDTTAVDTTIQTGPPAMTNATTATFTFSATELGPIYCKLDSGSYATCTSPLTISGLGAGAHTFEARAQDFAGNFDPTPAIWTWTIDVSPPETTIQSGPPATTAATSAGFTFTSSKAGSTFLCSLDNGSFSSCSSPMNYTNMAEGAHTFRVQAADGVGNADATPAQAAWSVDLTAPDTTIVSGPTGTVRTSLVTFTFSSEANASFQCRLQPAAFASCTSPQSMILPAGTQTFQVRATDMAGNADASPASRTFTVLPPHWGVDFSRDGKPDLLWRNAASGVTYLWRMNGISLISDQFVTSVDNSWKVVGTGDFNADGYSDFIFRHAASGMGFVWYLNDGTYTSDALLLADPPGLQVAGVADFNADGKVDLLLRDATTGEARIRFLDGVSLLSEQVLFGIDPVWKVEAIGDFTGDGQPDLLFRNSGSGLAFVWETLNSAGTVSLGASTFVFSIDPVWEVAQAGDWNGDGQVDLVFRNASSGLVFVWYMNGTTLTTSDFIIQIDPSWEIVPRR